MTKLRIPIKDFNSRIIGWVEIQENDDKILRDFYLRILGKYCKSSNLTKDFYGRIIGRGDCLTMLLNKK